MAVMPAQLPDLISAAGQSQEPPTATHVRLGQPGRRIGLPDAAGRANPDIGKRPRQRPQCLDTAGLLGREEFHEVEARRQRLHQFGSRRDPRRERQVACGCGFQQLRRRARADAEFGAERPRPRQIVGVQDRADADHGFRHLRDHGLGGLDGHRRAQRDFQHAHAAGDQCPRQRHRVFQPLDGQHRNDGGGLEDGGELVPALVRCGHGDALREVPGSMSPGGIAARGMIAPGWHTTTPARRCPARAASIGSAPAKARGDIGGGKTVAGRRGIDDGRLHRLRP